MGIEPGRLLRIMADEAIGCVAEPLGRGEGGHCCSSPAAYEADLRPSEKTGSVSGEQDQDNLLGNFCKFSPIPKVTGKFAKQIRSDAQ